MSTTQKKKNIKNAPTLRSKQSNQSKQVLIQLGVGDYGGLVPAFSAFSNIDEENEAVASCLDTNSTFCSKAEFSSIRMLKDGSQEHDYKSLDRLLQFSPNPLMSATVFWERVAYFYFKYNNAFIYIEKDEFGNIIALWSIDPSGVRFSKISTGEILLIFTLNGRELTIPYGMIIHIARNVTGNALFGRSNSSAISRVINLINLNYKGIENAIMTSTFARFIGEYTTKVSDKLKEETAKEFTQKYMGINTQNPVGIIYSDSNMKLTPISNSSQKTENYVTTNQWNQAVYKFYGCPEKVIAGTANESEMTAYYERTIDTFLMRTAQESTRKIFTDGEFSAGNRIVYSDRKLQYLTMSTRLSLFQAAREIGAFTLGTLGDIIGLPVPREKRNEIAYSQNYTNRTSVGVSSANKENGEEEDGN